MEGGEAGRELSRGAAKDGVDRSAFALAALAAGERRGKALGNFFLGKGGGGEDVIRGGIVFVRSLSALAALEGRNEVGISAEAGKVGGQAGKEGRRRDLTGRQGSRSPCAVAGLAA